MYCPLACSSPTSSDRFIIYLRGLSINNAIHADKVYFPLFYEEFRANGSRRHTPSPSMLAIHPWITTIKDTSITAEENLPPHKMLVSLHAPSDSVHSADRTIVYLPRPSRTTRHLINEIELMSAVCACLTATSRLQLEVYLPRNRFKEDRLDWRLRSAAVVIAPHGGALANLLFVPRDTVVVEMNDFSQGRWFFVALASLLGLKHIPVHASNYSHDDKTHQMRVDKDEFMEAFYTATGLTRGSYNSSSSEDVAHRRKCLKNIDILSNY
jgi:Glycosyltransferase 61